MDPASLATRRLALRCLLAGLGALALPRPGRAAEYPLKPVRLVVPFAPGSGLDDFSRLLAAYLEERLREPVLVESRTGGSTAVAASHVAHAAADGHTLLLAPASTMMVNPLLDSRLGYRVPDDFVPVARLMSVVLVLLVGADSGLDSLIALREHTQRRGPINLGHVTHVQRALHVQLMRSAGLQAVYVPYRSFPAALPDLLAGRIDAASIDASAAVPAVQSGRARALLVLGPQRTPVLPEVPTAAEFGLAPVRLSSWLALFAPAGTPADVVEQLSRAAVDFVHSPAAQRYFAQRGNVPSAAGGAELAQQMQREQPDWRRLVEDAGIGRD